MTLKTGTMRYRQNKDRPSTENRNILERETQAPIDSQIASSQNRTSEEDTTFCYASNTECEDVHQIISNTRPMIIHPPPQCLIPPPTPNLTPHPNIYKLFQTTSLPIICSNKCPRVLAGKTQFPRLKPNLQLNLYQIRDHRISSAIQHHSIHRIVILHKHNSCSFQIGPVEHFIRPSWTHGDFHSCDIDAREVDKF
jgi:hypothetical protein